MQGISFKYIFPAVFQLTSDKQTLIVSYKYSCVPYAICLAKTTESKIKYFLGAKYPPIQGFWNIKQPWSHYQCISLDYFHTGCFCTVRTMQPYRWKSLRGAAECNTRENSFTDGRLFVSTKLWCAESQAVTQDCQHGSAGRALFPPCMAAGAALEAHSKSEGLLCPLLEKHAPFPQQDSEGKPSASSKVTFMQARCTPVGKDIAGLRGLKLANGPNPTAASMPPPEWERKASLQRIWLSTRDLTFNLFCILSCSTVRSGHCDSAPS